MNRYAPLSLSFFCLLIFVIGCGRPRLAEVTATSGLLDEKTGTPATSPAQTPVATNPNPPIPPAPPSNVPPSNSPTPPAAPQPPDVQMSALSQGAPAIPVDPSGVASGSSLAAFDILAISSNAESMVLSSIPAGAFTYGWKTQAPFSQGIIASGRFLMPGPVRLILTATARGLTTSREISVNVESLLPETVPVYLSRSSTAVAGFAFHTSPSSPVGYTRDTLPLFKLYKSPNRLFNIPIYAGRAYSTQSDYINVIKPNAGNDASLKNLVLLGYGGATTANGGSFGPPIYRHRRLSDGVQVSNQVTAINANWALVAEVFRAAPN